MRRILIAVLLVIASIPLYAQDSIGGGIYNSAARRIRPLPAAPATPVEGDIYENTVTHDLWYYDGTAFRALSASGGAGGWPLLAPNGTTAAPSYSFTNFPTFGLYAASGVFGEAMGTGQINFTGTTAVPTALTAATVLIAGNVDVGSHSYQVTFVTPGGETSAGTTSNAVVSDGTHGQNSLSSVPLGGQYVTQRKIYRNKVAAQTSWFLQQTINDNTSTTGVQDNTADSGLGAAIPAANSANDTRLTLANDSSLTFGPKTGSNIAGVPSTITPSFGTGSAAGDQLTLQRSLMQGSGSSQHVGAHAVVICETKTLSNTSATTTTIATLGLASNTAAGLHAVITLTASDGTNFDSETQDVTVSYVNKAGVITVGTPLISTSTAANNSGSATIGATVTGATPLISLKVTPVFTTIVPTVVTVYTEIFSHGAGAVACQ